MIVSLGVIVPALALNTIGNSITLPFNVVVTVTESPLYMFSKLMLDDKTKYDSTSAFVYPKSLGLLFAFASLLPHQLFSKVVGPVAIHTPFSPSNNMEFSIVKLPVPYWFIVFPFLVSSVNLLP